MYSSYHIYPLKFADIFFNVHFSFDRWCVCAVSLLFFPLLYFCSFLYYTRVHTFFRFPMWDQPSFQGVHTICRYDWIWQTQRKMLSWLHFLQTWVWKTDDNKFTRSLFIKKEHKEKKKKVNKHLTRKQKPWIWSKTETH